MAKEINWITPQHAEKAAKKGLITAMECSYEHWDQLATATKRQLDEAFNIYGVNTGGDNCTLCVVHENSCEDCPIWGGTDAPVCCHEWIEARRAQGPCHTSPPDDYKGFRKAAANLRDLIGRALEKEKKK